MGEKRVRMRLAQRIKKAQPRCIFCGGESPSETVEHYPPRILFELKRRPQGLEFGACKECNEGSRCADLIAGFFSRLHPDASTQAGQEETRRIINQVAGIPGFAAEVQPQRNQVQALAKLQDVAAQLPSWNFVKIGDGPIVRNAMLTFGAKLGLAMHYLRTGRIVPKEGSVYARWFSNVQAYQGRIPKDLIDRMGPGETLRQGKFSVADQFRVSSLITENQAMSAHVAVFRNSFAMVMFVEEQASDMAVHPDARAPGFLKMRQAA